MESHTFVLDFSSIPPGVSAKEWNLVLKLYLIHISQNGNLIINDIDTLDSKIPLNRDLLKLIQNKHKKKNKARDKDVSQEYFGQLNTINQLAKTIKDEKKHLRQDLKAFKKSTRKLIQDDTVSENELENLNYVRNTIDCHQDHFKNKSICQPLSKKVLKKIRNAKWITQDTYQDIDYQLD